MTMNTDTCGWCNQPDADCTRCRGCEQHGCIIEGHCIVCDAPAELHRAIDDALTIINVTVGAMFFDDHASRFPELEPFIEAGRTHKGQRVQLMLTTEQARNMLGDARFYATEARYMDCPELGTAAKRVADALTKAGVA